MLFSYEKAIFFSTFSFFLIELCDGSTTETVTTAMADVTEASNTASEESSGGKEFSPILLILILILAGIPTLLFAYILTKVACATLQQRKERKKKWGVAVQSTQVGRPSSKIGFQEYHTPSTGSSSVATIESGRRETSDNVMMTSQGMSRDFEEEAETNVDERKKKEKRKKKTKGKKKKSTKK